MKAKVRGRQRGGDRAGGLRQDIEPMMDDVRAGQAGLGVSEADSTEAGYAYEASNSDLSDNHNSQFEANAQSSTDGRFEVPPIDPPKGMRIVKASDIHISKDFAEDIGREDFWAIDTTDTKVGGSQRTITWNSPRGSLRLLRS